MTILALDASSKAGSCALLADKGLIGEFFINVASTHSQTLAPMLSALLANTATPVEAVDVFAVSAGPGSFTGLRIGIASVKGMAFALDKPCAPVSTLECLAENLAFFSGTVVPVMDARRAQVYTAAFACGNGAPLRLWEDGALSIAALKTRLAAFAPRPVMLVGDGACLCMEGLRELSHVALAPEGLRHQRAGSVASVARRLAAEGTLCSAGDLAPVYLRLPQAERERLAKLAR